MILIEFVKLTDVAKLAVQTPLTKHTHKQLLTNAHPSIGENNTIDKMQVLKIIRNTFHAALLCVYCM